SPCTCILFHASCIVLFFTIPLPPYFYTLSLHDALPILLFLSSSHFPFNIVNAYINKVILSFVLEKRVISPFIPLYHLKCIYKIEAYLSLLFYRLKPIYPLGPTVIVIRHSACENV